MFDWLGDLLGNAFGSLGQQISSAIFDVMMKWIYEQIYNAVADFFTQMGNMGAEIFDLGVVQSTISLFTLFGWALFAAGTVVAVFDVAVEYQNGRASIKTTAINILKGFTQQAIFLINSSKIGIGRAYFTRRNPGNILYIPFCGSHSQTVFIFCSIRILQQ